MHFSFFGVVRFSDLYRGFFVYQTGCLVCRSCIPSLVNKVVLHDMATPVENSQRMGVIEALSQLLQVFERKLLE